MLRNGYVLIYCPNHPRTDSSGCVYEHILVAEKIIGRPIKKEEAVHHIDGNKTNNDPNNLMVFATDNEHLMFHYGAKVYQENNIWHAVPHEEKICPVCGKIFKYDYSQTRKIYCSVLCSNRSRSPLLTNTEIFKKNNKEELKEIQNMLYKANGNFSKVAKSLNVTSSGLAKRLKNNGLPNHSKDYKNMLP